jgi:hydroxymethylglutaryl-CoA reductase
MNGIDAVAIATGNDWRAIEAGVHAYASRDGQYRSLTRWSVTSEGEIAGELTLPLKIGIVGGSLRSNPSAVSGLKIANTESAVELAQLMSAVGLAQNFAAIRALVTDGIQKGHMKLHARSVAASVNTPDAVFDQVVGDMIASGDIKQWKARQIIEELQSTRSSTSAVKSLFDNEQAGTAAGKVILLGEHAVVYGKHALALPVERAIVACITEIGGDVHLRIPAWRIDQHFARGNSVQGGMTAALALIMQRLNIPDAGYRVDVEARIPAAMGLGSSASLAVAVIRAFDHLLQLGLDDDSVNSLAFDCEKLAHGDPSGVDNTLAVFGQAILFRKGDDAELRTLSLNERPPVVVATCNTRGSTHEQVAGVRRRYEKNPTSFARLMADIDELSVAGAVALQAGNYTELGSLMDICQGLLNALGVSTPELETMIDIARSNGAAGAKLTGGGGGGAIVAICPDTVSKVSGALRSAGYSIVPMVGY